MKKIRLLTPSQRDHAIETIRGIPLDGSWEVTFKETSKRSNPSNALLHVRIREVSKQIQWYGQWLSEADWKIMFSAAMHQESRIVPGINTSFVSLGYHTREMTQKEINDMIEFIHAFGSERNIIFSADPRQIKEDKT
jgi:hypothetical protein